jgi:glycosyltransferase involved in cell wall biosynthesis
VERPESTAARVTPSPVTLCVSTRNAGRLLAGCIESCSAWVEEIVIVDMESEDDTVEVARGYGARIVSVPSAGWAEPGRQAGIDAATRPWIFVLDADERATDELMRVVAGAVADPGLHGMRLPRRNITFGRWDRHSGIWPDYQLRLFRRESATWSPRIHRGPSVEGRVANAPARPEAAIVHHSFPTLSAWIASTDRYTDHEAERMLEEGQKPRVWRLLAVPSARFAEQYLARGGFRSGRYGLALALLSLVYWLLAHLKLWERSRTGALG